MQASASLLAGLAEQAYPRGLEGGFQRATGPRGATVSMPVHEAMLSHFPMPDPQSSIMNEARRIMQAHPENYISDEQLTRSATHSHLHADPVPLSPCVPAA